MRKLNLRRIGLLAAALGGLALLIGWAGAAWAAPNLQFTATPAPVSLPTISPTPAEVITSTPTRTPTPPGPALAEALEGATNVRASPNIEGDLLGQIYPGDLYPVQGRSEGGVEGARWLRIEYPNSPTGLAWVFEQVVKLSGNVDQIPDIPVSTEPTIDANQVGATQTVEGLALTPGALATATADAIIFGAAISGSPLPPVETAGPLPTFTYPATIAGPATPGATSTRGSETQEGLPPIIPIVALAAVGSFGLLVSLLRRG
jgi:hypothetical protein